MKPHTRKQLKVVKSKLKSRALLIPCAITSLGIFCGTLAVLKASDGQTMYALRCLCLAFLIDGLDGRVARRLNATSEFGKELDSLSDLIAFGVAPGVLIYHWAFRPEAYDLGVLIVFAYIICAALRLARFNLDEPQTDKKHFQGLPSPAAAACLGSLVYFFEKFENAEIYILGLSLHVVFLSFLMISNVAFPSPKHLKLSSISPHFIIPILSAAIALAWYIAPLTLALGFNAYAILGPIWLYYQTKKIKKSAATKPEVPTDS